MHILHTKRPRRTNLRGCSLAIMRLLCEHTPVQQERTREREWSRREPDSCLGLPIAQPALYINLISLLVLMVFPERLPAR
jgi:hypothetical protein